MYDLRYLPLARHDIREAIRYIDEELKNPQAALSLLDKMERGIVQLREFPYAHPLYCSPLRLVSEIRFSPVENYLLFYTVLEPEHVVEIMRVLYHKMDTRKHVSMGKTLELKEALVRVEEGRQAGCGGCSPEVLDAHLDSVLREAPKHG